MKMGAFETRREAVADAKNNLFCDWFLVICFDDGSWDYACPGRFCSIRNRKEQHMYQRSRTSGNWRIAR